MDVFKVAQNVKKYLGDFSERFSHPNLSKNAQHTGHTDGDCNFFIRFASEKKLRAENEILIGLLYFTFCFFIYLLQRLLSARPRRAYSIKLFFFATTAI